MIKFLIHRPIAVLMTFTAILLLGMVASGYLPVSLMPDIEIPEITVHVENPGASAREMDENIANPLRHQLMQVPHLDKLSSESRNGQTTIHLRFNYGADINYAFIDVNEKVDAAMERLPHDVDRPAIVKASASDLPVFYVNIRQDNTDNTRFMELSQLARSVFIKRMEQLSDVAMVDITGHAEPELRIEPDEQLLNSLGMTHDDISHAIHENNLTMGSLQVVDGQYIFNIRFSNALRTVEDVRNIRINTGKRILKLEELARVEKRPRKRRGAFLADDQQALSLAVIKQSDARMASLKENVGQMISTLEEEYPHLHFDIVRDQTELLDYSINNLRQNLLFGGTLAFFILFFFLKDARSPWIIGISVPVSIVVALLFFHLTGISINIISLSGLILGVGMMIDNSIIVIDNITQHLERGENLSPACIKGTNEVIRPLISSVLTTCAVFVPLIFLSGVSGALFYDQAMAVAIGLTASLLVSITLIPVLYHLFRKKGRKKKKTDNGKITKRLQRLDVFKTETLYEKGFDFIFKYRRTALTLFFLLMVPAVLLFLALPKERFPQRRQSETMLRIDWNEPISLDENLRRTKTLTQSAGSLINTSNTFAGDQQYKLHKEADRSVSEAMIYLKSHSPEELKALQQELTRSLKDEFPKSVFSWKVPESIFDKIFEQDKAFLTARITDQSTRGFPDIDNMKTITRQLQKEFPETEMTIPPAERYMEIQVQPERLALYEVGYSDLSRTLQTALSAWKTGDLQTGSHYVPILIGNPSRSLDDLLDELKVTNRNKRRIPVKELITTKTRYDYKILHGNAQGPFVPLEINSETDPEALMQRMSNELKTQHDADTQFTGSWFTSRQMIRELMVVLLVSLTLLYFILAAQFESLLQPIILLLEVPIDIAGALFLLWLFGGSLNLMAMIGIVVMSGIIVNDSILKIDTINRLRRTGMPLVDAIREGGNRRLKPIIMTSITTILALAPIIAGSGMGSELQRPLALTVIGGMILGTVVSLYFIPLCYYYLSREKTKKINQAFPERIY
ncbi:MAG: efflux RND transporter permease subunit [Marinilabiliaceae bacterium]